MNELKSTAAIVKAILEVDERARSNDSFLYFRVIGLIGHQRGIDVHQISVAAFLLNMKEWGFPKFESVRRTRQKVQQHHPELAACKLVAGYRDAQERVYREFAREEIP